MQIKNPLFIELKILDRMVGYFYEQKIFEISESVEITKKGNIISEQIFLEKI